MAAQPPAGAQAAQERVVGVDAVRLRRQRDRVGRDPVVDEEQRRLVRAAVRGARRLVPCRVRQLRGPGERVRRLLGDRLVGEVVPGRRRRPRSRRGTRRAGRCRSSRGASASARRSGRGRRARSRPASSTAPTKSRGLDVVLVDDHHDLAGVGDEEVAQVVERPRRAACRPSSQNEWHRYMPRSPSPEKPSRSRSRSAASTASRAHAVLARVAPQLLADRRRTCAGARLEAVGVVRVDEQPADAVAQLVGDRRVLRGRVPAGQRHRHRVVRRGERHVVERAVAQLARARCTARRRGRGGRRAARPEERADRRGDQQRRPRPPRPAAAGAARGRAAPRRRAGRGS